MRCTGIALVLCTVGCSTTRFEPPEVTARFSRSLPELVVRDLLDARPRVAEEASPWWWVPGFAATASVTGRPEDDERLAMAPTEDLADVIAALAAGSKQFSAVDRASSETSTDVRGYVLSGELVKLQVSRKRLTGRFGFLAIPLWLLGVPSERVDIDVSVAIHVDAAPELGPGWSTTLDHRRSRLSSWYVNRNWRELVVEDVARILAQEWHRAQKGPAPEADQ